jgi:DNA-binding transcriptional regulator YiaG
MPNLAATLKEEICRLAKKEIKAQTGATKQAVVQQRREIASLRRQVKEQDKKIRFLQAQEQKGLGEKPKAGEKAMEGIRFSGRSVKAQRKQLGLSAKDYAKIVGVSEITIYNWEQGKSRPREAQLTSLVAVRGITKREALAKLKVLKTKEKKVRPKKKRKKR